MLNEIIKTQLKPVFSHLDPKEPEKLSESDNEIPKNFWEDLYKNFKPLTHQERNSFFTFLGEHLLPLKEKPLIQEPVGMTESGLTIYVYKDDSNNERVHQCNQDREKMIKTLLSDENFHKYLPRMAAKTIHLDEEAYINTKISTSLTLSSINRNYFNESTTGLVYHLRKNPEFNRSLIKQGVVVNDEEVGYNTVLYSALNRPRKCINYRSHSKSLTQAKKVREYENAFSIIFINIINEKNNEKNQTLFESFRDEISKKITESIPKLHFYFYTDSVKNEFINLNSKILKSNDLQEIIVAINSYSSPQSSANRYLSEIEMVIAGLKLAFRKYNNGLKPENKLNLEQKEPLKVAENSNEKATFEIS